jgi:ribonuclease HII
LYDFDYDMAVSFKADCVCGIDEAGRGPLAGDVFAAAVILEPGKRIPGLDDSKKLTSGKREALYDEIIACSAAYLIARASVAEIDELNILKGTFLAMERAYAGLSDVGRVPQVLVDGNKIPNIGGAVAVVKGDSLSAAIAAASILAKVARDRYALELDALYPEYGFAKHKGYGTTLHREMLLKYGATPIHRSLFVRKILGQI